MKPLGILLTISFSILSAFVFRINAQSISTRDIIQPISEFVPCANNEVGEIVEGNIVIHGVLHFNKEGMLTKFHYQPQGGTMIGQTTGTTFHATGVTQGMFPASNGAINETFINRYHFVGKGGIQFRVFDTIHITINANGEMSAFVENSLFECK